MFKIMTNLVLLKINKHITMNNIMCENQKGCRQDSRGCKEQLIIDHVICAQAKKRNKNISVAWVDYSKAYDSVPHSWLLEILHIDPTLKKKNSAQYETMCTILCLSLPLMYNNTKITSPTKIFDTGFIPICKGIFQGDGWSPQRFCLALNPLSNILN